LNDTTRPEPLQIGATAKPGARRRARPWKWIGIGMAATGVVALALWWSFGRGDAAVSYRTTKVERGALTAVVSSSGTLNAVINVQVGSQISGQVRDLYADFNSQVKKGDLLARIDPQTFRLKVQQAEADLDAARTSLINQQGNVAALRSQLLRARIQAQSAKVDFDRKQDLVAKGFISAAELDNAKFNYQALDEAVRTAEAQLAAGDAQVANAAAQLKQRTAALASANVDLDRTEIRAPVSGVVISRAVDAGQTVAASLQAPTLFTIAQDLRDMQVETAIDESDIGRIRLDQPATFTVDAFPGRTFRGTVKQIRKAAQNVQNVVTYTVVIATANPDLALVPGMTANARIVTDSRDGVLKVANAALRYRPPGAPAIRDEPTPVGPGNGGASDAQARRARIVSELKLDAGQQARLDEIFAELRTRMAELRDVPEADRRARSERFRADMRQKIGAMLTPEQQRAYAEIVASDTGRGGATSGRVYVRDADSSPREIRVRLGLTDGNATEILGSDLKEGDSVITGSAERNASAPKSSAPGPRLPF
jgi:HlyD family secretion protein